MSMKTTRRGPHRTTVLLVTGLVGALLIGTTGGAVAAGLITSKQIKNGTIKAVDIKNNTITGKKIRNGTVSTKDVKNGSLKAKDIKTSSLTGALVKDGSLTGADLAVSTLTGEHFVDGSLTGADVKDGSLMGADIKAGSLTGTEVKAGSLTGSHVEDGALTGADVEDGSLTAADLAIEARAVWAVVNSNGTLARGSEGVSAELDTTGTYNVFFPIDVDQCAFSATVGNASSGVPAPGLITTTPLSVYKKAVYVKTYDSSAVSSNRSFHLVVNC